MGAVMRDLTIIWDLPDDANGNVQHVAEHGLTPEEVDDVLRDPAGTAVSETSGRPAVFGYTKTGRFIMVVFEECDTDVVYPVTAYDVPEKGRRHGKTKRKPRRP